MLSYASRNAAQSLDTASNVRVILERQLTLDSIAYLQGGRNKQETHKENNQLDPTDTIQGKEEVLPLVTNVEKLIDTVHGGKINFMEWLQELVDYDVVDRFRYHEERPYLIGEKIKKINAENMSYKSLDKLGNS